MGYPQQQAPFQPQHLPAPRPNRFKYTKDKKILDMVSGVSIDVAKNIDQNRFVRELKFSPEEQQAINQQINEFVQKRAVVPCRRENIQFSSNIFVTLKKAGGYRTILNLKKLKDYVDKIKFKIKTLESILQLVTPLYFMMAIDLVNA